MCTEIYSLPGATQRRVRVHRLRTCIEKVAAAAFANVTGASPRQSRIRVKLLSLLATPHPGATESEALGAIRATQRVYVCASDVLHGRVSQVNLHEVTVAEWEAAVGNLLGLWPSMGDCAACPDCGERMEFSA